MGLYGNKFINSSVVEEITYEQMMDIYYDSHYQIESLFRDIDHSYLSLNEDTLAISGPVQKASFKETLKKIIDKAKELFDNFVKWISTCIKRFTEWITKVYNQTNVKDSIMSKIGKNLTWDNIKSAIEQGWKGLPKEKGLCLVKEMNPATLRASELLRDATNKDKEYNKIIEKINNTETLEIAEEHYKEFESSFKSKTRWDTIPSSVNMIIWHNDLKLSSKDLKARFNNLTEEDLLYDYITFSAGESQDKKHLLVNESGFNSTKKMALSGETLTKQYKNDLDDAVKVIKQDVLDPLQRESKNISNGEALTDNDKIYLIYNKARIKVAEYVVKLGMRAVKDQTTIMKYLNSQAIRTYLYLLGVNRKYNKNSSTDGNSDDAVSKEFKEAVEKKDKMLVRIMLKDLLLISMKDNFKKFDASLKYASSKLSDLYDDNTTDDEEIITDTSKWTKDYMNHQMVVLVNNFTRRRLNHIKQVIKKVYNLK